MAECDVSTLIDQACSNGFLGLDSTQKTAVLLQLLCNATGGGGAVSTQIYTSTDADPNSAAIVPSDITKGAIFYQDPSITLYNEWRWSPEDETWFQTQAP